MVVVVVIVVAVTFILVLILVHAVVFIISITCCSISNATCCSICNVTWCSSIIVICCKWILSVEAGGDRWQVTGGRISVADPCAKTTKHLTFARLSRVVTLLQWRPVRSMAAVATVTLVLTMVSVLGIRLALTSPAVHLPTLGKAGKRCCTF